MNYQFSATILSVSLLMLVYGQVEFDFQNMPHSDKLMIYWPLTSETQLLGYLFNGSNTSYTSCQLSNSSSAVLVPFGGPFNKGGYSVSSPKTSIGSCLDPSWPTSSFTIAFYYNSQGSANSTAILSIDQIIQIQFERGVGIVASMYDDLSGWTDLQPLAYNGSYWVFFAFVHFSSTNKTVAFMKSLDGSSSETKLSPTIYIRTLPETALVSLGQTNKNNMYPGDQLACVTIYRVAFGVPSDVQALMSLKCAIAMKMVAKRLHIKPNNMPALANLIAFWPLTRETLSVGYRFSGKSLSNTTFAVQQSENATLLPNGGPFETGSYSVSFPGSGIGIYSGIPSRTSFTIAFYYYSQCPSSDQSVIVSVEPHLEAFCNTTSGDMVARFGNWTVGNQRLSVRYSKGTWTFFAFRYQTSLNSFKREINGSLTTMLTLPNPVYLGERTDVVALGKTSDYGMFPGDQLACVTLYNTVLSGENVERLYASQCATNPVVPSITQLTIDSKAMVQLSSLIAFWPLRNDTFFDGYLFDGSGSSVRAFPIQQLGNVDFIADGGPYNQGCYSVTNPAQPIGLYGQIPPWSSLTISFYYNSDCSAFASAIFLLEPGVRIFWQRNEGVVVPIHQYTQPEKWDPVEKIPYSNNGPGTNWTFFAFAYDSTTHTFTSYVRPMTAKETTVLIHRSPVNLTTNSTARLAGLGHTTNADMYPGNQLACVTLHNTALAAVEIDRLIETECATVALNITNTAAPFSYIPNVSSMPRQSSLIAFWPLTNAARLTGFLFNSSNPTRLTATNTVNSRLLAIKGPFNEGSYSVFTDYEPNAIGVYTIANKPPSEDFAVAFYYLSKCSNLRERFLSMQNVFSISCDPENGITFSAGSRAVLQGMPYSGNVWTFFAFTFDSALRQLSIYRQAIGKSLQQVSAHGVDVPVNPATKDTVIRFGDQKTTFYKDDYLACVSLYGVALTLQDVQQLADWQCGTAVLTTTTASSAGANLTTTTESGSMTFFAVSDFSASESIRQQFIADVPERALPLENSTTLQRLCSHFAATRVIPPSYDNTPFKVSISMGINNLIGLTSVDQVISVQAILLLNWTILTCPRGDLLPTHGQWERIQVTSRESIWQPHIRFISNADSDVGMATVPLFEDFILLNKGLHPEEMNRTLQFYWTREGEFSSFCSLRLENFPYDQQTCTFDFALVRSMPLLQFDPNGIFLTDQNADDDSGWTILGLKNATYGQSRFNGYQAAVVSYGITLKRDPIYYVTNFVLPCTLLSALDLTTFFITPDAADRPVASVTILLALAVTQSQVANQVPKTAPYNLLSNYVQQTTGLVAGCTLYGLVTLWLACSVFGGKRGEQPRWCGERGVTLIRFIDMGGIVAASAAFLGINIQIWSPLF